MFEPLQLKPTWWTNPFACLKDLWEVFLVDFGAWWSRGLVSVGNCQTRARSNNCPALTWCWCTYTLSAIDSAQNSPWFYVHYAPGIWCLVASFENSFTLWPLVRFHCSVLTFHIAWWLAELQRRLHIHRVVSCTSTVVKATKPRCPSCRVYF